MQRSPTVPHPSLRDSRGGFRALTVALWVVGAFAAVAGPAVAILGAVQAPGP